MKPVVIKIFGPPGTGKTTWLIKKMLFHLKNGLGPEDIAYLSFTKSQAMDAKKRAVAITGYSWKDFTYFGTVHSLAFSLLGIDRDSVFSDEKLYDFCKSIGLKAATPRKKILEEPEYYDIASINYEGNQCHALYELARNKMPNQEPRKIYFDRLIQPVREQLSFRTYKYFIYYYEKYKKENGLFDFTDFIVRCIKERLVPPVRVLIVDEYQDISPLEDIYIRLIAQNCDFVYLGGDEDQTLYSYLKGCDPKIFLNWPGVSLVLKKSYRLPEVVSNFCQEIIKKNIVRMEKTFSSNGEMGELHYVDPLRFDYSDFDGFILSRNWYWLRKIEEHLLTQGIFFEKANKEKYYSKAFNEALIVAEKIQKNMEVTTKELDKLFKWIRSEPWLKHGAKAKVKKETDIVYPSEYLLYMNQNLLDKIKDGLDKFIDICTFRSKAVSEATAKSLYKTTIKKWGTKILEKGASVKLASMHYSKGLEANDVLVLPDMTYASYQNFRLNPEDERRIFYVGASRAKERLFISEVPFSRWYFRF